MTTPEITRIRAALEAGWSVVPTEWYEATTMEAMTAVLAHIDHQQAEIERLKILTSALHNIETAGFQLVEMNQQLMLEIERLRDDAARYRWLREQSWHDKGLTVTQAKNVQLGSYCPNKELLDAAIDAAMEQL